MGLIRNLLFALLPMIAAPAGAGGRLPDEATGKVAGIYVEVAPDVYRPATAKDTQKQGVPLWADIRFNPAVTGKLRPVFVRIAQYPESGVEQGDLVKVRLARPTHPFAHPLGALPERDTVLSRGPKYFTEAAINYDRAPENSARLE